MATNTTLVGWIPESGGRGTWKVLWLCLSTIALAVWVCYHPAATWNSKRSWLWYAQRDITSQAARGCVITLDMLFGLLIPEFYIFLGIYQLIEARSCRKSIQKLSKQDFTLREAFFITMGGYQVLIPQSCLQNGDSELDGQTYVLRTAHILWLLSAGVLDLPAKDHSTLDDLDDEIKKAMEDVSSAERGLPHNTPSQTLETTGHADHGPAHNTPLPILDTIGPIEHGSARSTPSPTVETIGSVEHESARSTPSPTAGAIGSGDLDDDKKPDSLFVTCFMILGIFIGICFGILLGCVYRIWNSVKTALETKDDSVATSTTNTQGPPQALLTSQEVIQDRSHSDGTAKFIVVLQCIWFLVNCIGRGVHYLPLSLLEVVTLAYIVFTLGAYALWWEKPQGVKETTVFTPELEDSQWKELAALNSTEYFVNATHGVENKTDKWLFGLLGWEYLLEDMYSDKSKRSVWLVFCLASWSSAALHCIAWNTQFPTVAEQTVWRVFVVLLFITPLPTVADSRLFFHGRGHFTRLRFRWRLQMIGLFIAAMSKLGILILAFISLRAAPEAIYDTWEISNWLLFWLPYIRALGFDASGIGNGRTESTKNA